MMMNNSTIAQSPFLSSQLRFERVQNAYNEKWNDLKIELNNQGFDDTFELCINAYKNEGKLEIWLKKLDETKFKFFKTYDFCAHSGTLGPKVIEGDLQTPEGFYEINIFNPESSYHLSLGVNYPNNVDLKRTGKKNKPGGDIYVHGDCFTVGCIPLTDEKIKEVYLLAVHAKSNGQEKIFINIFPFKMNKNNMNILSEKYPQHLKFWQTLQKGYLAFEENKFLPKITQVNGEYILN